MIFETTQYTLHDFRSKKPRNTSETNNLIRVPTIKVEKEEPSKKDHPTKPSTNHANLARLKTLQSKSPLKVSDFTDKLFKDIPKFSFAEALISPKLKTKLVSSIESPPFDELTGAFSKTPLKGHSRIKLQKSYWKRSGRGKDMESEFLQEYLKKQQEARLNRPVSPWLFSGQLKKRSIFS
jgi:hypothetical protein